MITNVAVTRSMFDQALVASRSIGIDRPVPGLNADLDATLRGDIAGAWDAVERALKQAFMFGREVAREAIQSARQRIEELVKQVGARAREFHAILLSRLREFVNEFLSQALSTMPENVKIGTRSFTITSVTWTQKLSLGGSVEANLTKLCELVSEGELELEVEYGVGGTGPHSP